MRLQRAVLLGCMVKQESFSRRLELAHLNAQIASCDAVLFEHFETERFLVHGTLVSSVKDSLLLRLCQVRAAYDRRGTLCVVPKSTSLL